MKKIHNLNEAVKFLDNKFKSMAHLEDVLYNFDDIHESLKFFIGSKEREKYFREFTNKYFELVKSSGQEMQKGAYRLLETLCIEIDNKSILRKGYAIKSFQDSLREIHLSHDIESYQPQYIYERIDFFLNKLKSKYGGIISNPYKKWNNKKNKMDFKFKLSEYDISGNLKLDNKKLVLDGKLPFGARLHRDEIESKIKERLEKAFPSLE
jgi:hypothetical protein